MESCASLLARHFKKWGIDHIFGIPGKAIAPLIFATDKHDVEFVLSKHESGAGYNAAGYAMQNRKLGVALGTSGPGGTNLLTAAGQAKASNAPVLIITGHPSMRDTGKAMGQDSSMFGTDLQEMFKPVTKFSARVERSDLLEIYLRHALEHAYSGVKGPVHLNIPFDILIEEIEPFDIDLPELPTLVSPNLLDVRDKLNDATRPLILVGKGVHSSNAYEELQRLSEHWRIPVMTTPGGKGTFLSSHELSLGGLGLGGTDESKAYIAEGVDTLVVIGSKLSDMSIVGLTQELYPDHLIHFDHEPTFIGKTIGVPTTPVLGDIRANLRFILDQVDADPVGETVEEPLEQEIEDTHEGDRMSAVTTLQVVRQSLPDDAIVYGDDGSHSFYGIRYYDIKRRGSFFFDDVFGAMGHAIGYSIGAKLASPNETIVCLVGDGCMFMHGAEISTAQNYDSAVLFIVLNNGRLDMVEKGMRKMIGKSIGAVYDAPLDASLFAKSMGLTSYKTRSKDELSHAISEALAHIAATNKPAVVEVLVDENETPPTMGRQ
ncbi:thiamine pyrophosphate-binding protein [Paenalkalicoccus suaedae]|uniref:Thiamine pyrophosphate-binding protein n=1 Tax=Paenalkalicoccus suaedae TaxID=2592382 RepID=A0A859FC17_9BACI|nr:thiamine pyrophosphate-binding protein [Paenalkalicoccus suaedae]QKS70490.1 thiamine pyrophosphate-binding protein [Paenalkalicoccus suaedae]